MLLIDKGVVMIGLLIIVVFKGCILVEVLLVMVCVGLVLEVGFGDEDDWCLCFVINCFDVDLICVCVFDVVIFVVYGVVQVGVVGFDVIDEFDYVELYVLVDLGIGCCWILVVEFVGMVLDDDLFCWSYVCVVIKYLNFICKYFVWCGVQVEIVKFNGVMELVFMFGFFSWIVDLVLLGWMLKDNGLVEVEVIVEVFVCVIVNCVVMKICDDVMLLVEVFWCVVG